MQPDIEIYVLSCPTDRIIDWLTNEFFVVQSPSTQGLCTKLWIKHNEADIEVTILEQAAGKRFTSIWFNSDKTPWATDADCAQHAYQALQHEIRCNFQGWEEAGDQDPDQWWRVNVDGAGPFIWN
ncbi:hypothetical protein [Marinomonas sp.]